MCYSTFLIAALLVLLGNIKIVIANGSDSIRTLEYCHDSQCVSFDFLSHRHGGRGMATKMKIQRATLISVANKNRGLI